MALQIKKKNLGSNQVDGSKILLGQGQAIRGFDQNGVEKDLIEFGESGEILVNGSEVAHKTEVEDLQSQITNVLSNVDPTALDSLSEVVAAFEAADASLNGAITSLATSLSGEINAEEAARITGDSTLQANINAEALIRESGDDATLFAANENTEARVIVEQNARIAGDDATLASSQSYTDAQVIVEQNARIAGDDATLAAANLYADNAIAAIPPVDLTGYATEQYVDNAIAAIPPVDLSAYETISNVDSKDAAKLLEAKAYADQVSLSAQEASQNYADGLFQTLEQTVDQGLNASLLIDGSRGMEGNLIMGDESGLMHKISGLADGTSDHDAVNKSQMEASSLQAENNAKAYTDAEQTRALAAEASLQSQITNVLSNVDGAALDSLTEIVTAFQAADSNLNGAITSLASSASSALSAEESARIAADSALQGEIDAEEIARAAADTTLQNNINSEASARQSADQTLQDNIDAEETRAMGVEAQLQSDLDDLDGYAQDIRSDVDDLDGYAQDIRSDLDAEMARVATVESGFDSRLDALEAQTDGPSFHKMKIEVSENLAYVELAHEAIANSIVVSVGRLMAHKDEDFTVSVVGGVTRLTWIGSMVSPDGVEAIESGDKVFVTYAY